MAKRQNLVFVVIGQIFGIAAFYLVAIAVVYWAIAEENHSWPHMSQDGLEKWQAICVWAAGYALFALLFLITKQVLKRRNFDLETVNDETVVESWPTWLLKKAVTYVGIVLITVGGFFLFPLFGLMSVPELLSILRSKIAIVALGFGILGICEIVFEIFRRLGLKLKAAKPEKPRKPI